MFILFYFLSPFIRVAQPAHFGSKHGLDVSWLHYVALAATAASCASASALYMPALRNNRKNKNKKFIFVFDFLRHDSAVLVWLVSSIRDSSFFYEICYYIYVVILTSNIQRGIICGRANPLSSIYKSTSRK